METWNLDVVVQQGKVRNKQIRCSNGDTNMQQWKNM